MSLNMETIQQALDKLLHNHSECNRLYYDIYFSEDPQDIELEYYDDDGNLTTITIPNRAKLTQWYKSTHVPPRNSILYGKIDSVGAPAHLILNAGAAEIDASPVMLLINFAAGIEETGPVDHIEVVTSDNIFSGLTVSSTCFLYIERNASTGDLSYGHTVLTPITAKVAPSNPEAGQHWYDSHTGRMMVYEDGAWTAVQRVWLGSCVTDADGTVTSVSPAAIGMAVSDADFMALLDRLDSKPYDALDYPHICTDDNRITVSAAAATAGGVVTVDGGESIVLAESTADGMGRLRTLEIPAFASADLTANSTYYLRAQIDDGELQVYLQLGTDADAIPDDLLGTPNGEDSGGFDSTKLDVLLAKIATGDAASVPTVTTLCNAHRLAVSANVTGTVTNSEQPSAVISYALQLQWGRVPDGLPAVNISALNALGGTNQDDWDLQLYHACDYDRYGIAGEVVSDYASSASNVTMIYVAASA